MCEVFPPFLLDIVVCDAQKHKYYIYSFMLICSSMLISLLVQDALMRKRMTSHRQGQKWGTTYPVTAFCFLCHC